MEWNDLDLDPRLVAAAAERARDLARRDVAAARKRSHPRARRVGSASEVADERRSSLATIATVATVLSSSGCFTSWAGMRLGGKPGAWDEHVREETVPLPGISERLVVALPLRSPTFELECNSVQNGNDAVYHSAYRYGSGWKKATGIMFLAEAALGAVLLATEANTKPGNVVLGAFLAADGLGTGVLFFVPQEGGLPARRQGGDDLDPRRLPRRPRARHRRRVIPGRRCGPPRRGRRRRVRCVARGGSARRDRPAAASARVPYAPPAYGAPVTQTAPTSAAAVAMAPPGAAPGPLLVSFDGKSQELPLGYIDRCVLNHVRHPETPPCSSTNTLVTAMFEVPVGTLGRVATSAP